jgi:hypothetical protein
MSSKQADKARAERVEKRAAERGAGSDDAAGGGVPPAPPPPPTVSRYEVVARFLRPHEAVRVACLRMRSVPKPI